jgi:hypothetical protein
MEFSFRPPPKLEQITPEALSAISDDEIEGSLVSYVVDLAPSEVNELEALDRLPDALRTWYVAFIVDAEILNGGFNQLFFNSSGALAPEAPAAFTALGIPEAGDLVDRALSLLEDHAPALEKAQEAGTIEAFMETYLDQPFEELDNAYAEQQEKWAEARLRFIRKHSSQFSQP